MNAPIVTAGGLPGIIFEGEIPATYCFVPLDCILDEEGELRIAEVGYVSSGWSVRNMRISSELDGHHLFPKPDRLVQNLDPAPLQKFLSRLNRGQTKLAI